MSKITIPGNAITWGTIDGQPGPVEVSILIEGADAAGYARGVAEERTRWEAKAMTDARANDIAREEIEAGESGIHMLGEHVFWNHKPTEWAAVFRIALARVIRRSHGMPY